MARGLPLCLGRELESCAVGSARSHCGELGRSGLELLGIHSELNRLAEQAIAGPPIVQLGWCLKEPVHVGELMLRPCRKQLSASVVSERRTGP